VAKQTVASHKVGQDTNGLIFQLIYTAQNVLRRWLLQRAHGAGPGKSLELTKSPGF
jgi:hypothetical protein